MQVYIVTEMITKNIHSWASRKLELALEFHGVNITVKIPALVKLLLHGTE